jgi:hypothetical protein
MRPDSRPGMALPRERGGGGGGRWRGLCRRGPAGRRRGGWSAVDCQVWRVRVGCRAARASALVSASTLRRLVCTVVPPI